MSNEQPHAVQVTGGPALWMAQAELAKQEQALDLLRRVWRASHRDDSGRTRSKLRDIFDQVFLQDLDKVMDALLNTSENTVCCEDVRGTNQYPEETPPKVAVSTSKRGTAAPVSQQSAAAQNTEPEKCPDSPCSICNRNFMECKRESDNADEPTRYPTPALDAWIGGNPQPGGCQQVLFLRDSAQSDIAAAVGVACDEWANLRQRDLEACAAERERLKDRIAELEERIVELGVQLIVSRKQVGEAQEQRDLEQIECNSLKEKNRKLKEENFALARRPSDSRVNGKRISDLEREVAAERAISERHRESLAMATATLRQTDAERDALRDENSKMQKRIAELEYENSTWDCLRGVTPDFGLTVAETIRERLRKLEELLKLTQPVPVSFEPPKPAFVPSEETVRLARYNAELYREDPKRPGSGTVGLQPSDTLVIAIARDIAAQAAGRENFTPSIGRLR